eukprot:UN00910
MYLRVEVEVVRRPTLLRSRYVVNGLVVFLGIGKLCLFSLIIVINYWVFFYRVASLFIYIACHYYGG